MANRTKSFDDPSEESLSGARNDPDVQKWISKYAEAATASNVPAVQSARVSQLIETITPDCAPEMRAGAQYAATHSLASIAPKNEIEAMRATQMIAVNDAAMECLKRAAMARMYPEDDGRDLRHAVKLLQIFPRQINSLTKLRGSSEQFEKYNGLFVEDVPASLRKANKPELDPRKMTSEERCKRMQELVAEAAAHAESSKPSGNSTS